MTSEMKTYIIPTNKVVILDGCDTLLSGSIDPTSIASIQSVDDEYTNSDVRNNKQQSLWDEEW